MTGNLSLFAGAVEKVKYFTVFLIQQLISVIVYHDWEYMLLVEIDVTTTHTYALGRSIYHSINWLTVLQSNDLESLCHVVDTEKHSILYRIYISATSIKLCAFSSLSYRTRPLC